VLDERTAIVEADERLCGDGERPGPTATVGMFLDYVAQCPNGVVLSVVSGVARDAKTVELTGIS
jgi:hypothetical protein